MGLNGYHGPVKANTEVDVHLSFGKYYLDRSPLARSLETRAWRHWKAKPGFFFSSSRLSAGALLKRVGTGPRIQS